MSDQSHFELLYYAARCTIVEMQHQIRSQHKLIEELEKQLEPDVVAEIREALSMDGNETEPSQ